MNNSYIPTGVLDQLYQDADAFITIGIHSSKDLPGTFFFGIGIPTYRDGKDREMSVTVHRDDFFRGDLPAAVAEAVKELIQKANICWEVGETNFSLR
jgi:hypothetical protein